MVDTPEIDKAPARKNAAAGAKSKSTTPNKPSAKAPNTDKVRIALCKTDAWYARIDGIDRFVFTYGETAKEVPDRVALMLGMQGYVGEITVEWVGDDSEGEKLAKRLNSPRNTSD